MPPHPGPVAAASVAGVNLGMVFLMGAIVAFPVWYLAGYRFALFMARRFDIEIPTILGAQEPGERELPGRTPSFGAVIGLLLLPVVLIAGNTITSTLQSSGVVAESATWAQIVRFLGETPVAMVIAVMASLLVLGYARRVPWNNLTKIVDKGFMPVASIIMVAGAGGMFGGVLRETGIGDALATVLDSIGLPLIASAYLISVALRVAQGSATVAITTTAGLLGPAVIASSASPAQLGLVIVAMGAGSFFASHVNDSGFWLVGGLLQMDTATTLRLWTVFTSVISLAAFAVAALLYLVV